MDHEAVCDLAYGRMDDLLDVLTRSKAMHIMLVLDQQGRAMRFTDLKRIVDSTSTTVSRRLKELKAHGLVQQTDGDESSGSYALSDDAKSLSPIFHNLFNWSRRVLTEAFMMATSFAAMGGSVIECPASPMMCSRLCGAAVCKSHALRAGHTTS